jgi:geranylgeranyl diphosphate synthase type I
VYSQGFDDNPHCGEENDLTTARALASDPIEAFVQPIMRAAVDHLDGDMPLLAGMGRYHLGWVDRDFAPAANVDQGKRMRPEIALLCCQAAGGALESAAPLAAAIELLHNFTLVHDDIQDRAPKRRHRDTVWANWGESQAINAGDALFAAAHLALFESRRAGVAAECVLTVAEAFNRMAIEIVAGQVADLSFETRSDVRPDEYLAMIAGKTAAIVQFAAWAGAEIAGADAQVARAFGEFGLALGLGFQIQDDLLGIWASAAETGKAAADDIRRKKKSLPVLMLNGRANPADRAALDRRYAAPEIDADGVAEILALLQKYAIRPEIETQVRAYHDRAKTALLLAAPVDSPARAALLHRIHLLASRSK